METLPRNPSKNTVKLLGIAFLFVLIVSAVSGFLLSLCVESDSVDIISSISQNLALYKASILGELMTSIGVVVLAVLLYAILHTHNKVIAWVALGLWITEAVALALSKLGAFALIVLSTRQDIASHIFAHTLADILYHGFDRTGYKIHFMFYCFGAVLWFYLFYKSRYIPRFMALWGIVAESFSVVGSIWVLFDERLGPLYFVHLALLELVIGLWLIFKGIKNDAVD